MRGGIKLRVFGRKIFIKLGDCQFPARTVVAVNAQQEQREEAQRDRLPRKGQLFPTYRWDFFPQKSEQSGFDIADLTNLCWFKNKVEMPMFVLIRIIFQAEADMRIFVSKVVHHHHRHHMHIDQHCCYNCNCDHHQQLHQCHPFFTFLHL